MKTPLEKAIQKAGGQTALASLINKNLIGNTKKINQRHIWNWLNRDKKVPPEYALPIARSVKYKVLPSEIRPDVYPNELCEEIRAWTA